MNSTNAMSNGICHKAVAQASPSLIQNGKLVWQTYNVCSRDSCVYSRLSDWLGNCCILRNCFNDYIIVADPSMKREQRYIVRILFMVPLYALVSFASFVFWNHSTPLLLARDAYEAIVLTAFFYLLLIYLSPDIEEQKSVLLKLGISSEVDNVARRNGQEVKKWIFPLCFVNWKPNDGLYFLQPMKWGVLQYCIIRPTYVSNLLLACESVQCVQNNINCNHS